MLTGAFARTVDEKLRVAIPKRIRDDLGLGENASLYVTPGTDGSLALYAPTTFQRLGERLGQSSPTQQDVRAFARLFYGQAQQAELDSQGRIRIPPELARLA